MKEKVKLTQILEKTETVCREKIESSRLGWLVKLDLENDLIYVDYENNPLNVPVQANLSNPELSLSHLEQSQEIIKHLQLTFMDGNPALPVIKDVLYSAVSLDKKKDKKSSEYMKLHLRADEIVLEGKTKVTVKCGEASTTYLADGNQIVQDAEKINSSATLTHKVKGGTIALN